MNVNEFTDSKGEVHSTSAMQPDVILEGIKVYLKSQKCARNVENWNELRDYLKVKFGKSAVSKLDASAYITEWMKQKGETA